MDFTPEEVRVLGVLIEKELTTPDYYPLTLNSLTTACNQKSNRDPVVDFSESTVMRALDSLMRRKVVGHAAGGGSRAEKFRHALAEAWGLSEAERAVLSIMLLRGPQTVGELRARTGRSHPFESLEEVEAVLAELAAREQPLVTELPVLPGKKEARHTHLLEGEPDLEAIAATEPAPARSGSAGLSEEVAELRERLEALEAAFEAFKTQFE
ncbi:MAG: YceH family protein [Rhodothermales bacterium]|nr:YceH family protein [Rhodothermales bacterium]MBO6778421.1 YceH family protein [Rhodothermales bacterium]